MKKILLLFIASSLSLFATIRGYDENVFIKVYKQKGNVPIQRTSDFYETDNYIEPSKKSSKGGKEIVFEYTLESDIDTKPYLKMFGEEGYSLTYCKMFIGDKLDNVIVVKLRQNGKVVAEYKADAKKCSSKLK